MKLSYIGADTIDFLGNWTLEARGQKIEIIAFYGFYKQREIHEPLVSSFLPLVSEEVYFIFTCDMPQNEAGAFIPDVKMPGSVFILPPLTSPVESLHGAIQASADNEGDLTEQIVKLIAKNDNFKTIYKRTFSANYTKYNSVLVEIC